MKSFIKNKKGFALIQAIGLAAIAIVLISVTYRATNAGVTGWLGSIDNNMDAILAQSTLGGGSGGGGSTPIIPPVPETPDPELNPSGTIPAGAYYGSLNTGTIYDEMPLSASDGDIYLQGQYVYNYYSEYDGWWAGLATIESGITAALPDYPVTDKNQIEYEPILESINGKPVTVMQGVFEDCTLLEKAPAIPSGVTNMAYTFSGCTALTDVSNLVIPSSVTNMSHTFQGCTALEKAPDMSNASSVTNMYYTFSGCTALTDVSDLVIPSSVTDMSGTFYGCTALTKAPAIPSSVTNMYFTFSGCTALTKAPDMSQASSVTNMSHTFQGCTALEKAPDMSNASSVTNMYYTFSGCSALEKAPAIPSSVTDMECTFLHCTSLTKAPVIPNSVIYLDSTFKDCTSLTGEVEINATNLTDYTYCFRGTEKPITITGITPFKAELAATANNGNVTY